MNLPPIQTGTIPIQSQARSQFTSRPPPRQTTDFSQLRNRKEQELQDIQPARHLRHNKETDSEMGMYYR